MRCSFVPAPAAGFGKHNGLLLYIQMVYLLTSAVASGDRRPGTLLHVVQKKRAIGSEPASSILPLASAQQQLPLTCLVTFLSQSIKLQRLQRDSTFQACILCSTRVPPNLKCKLSQPGSSNYPTTLRDAIL